jgi:GNAT superfamily N-acetyltransferase
MILKSFSKPKMKFKVQEGEKHLWNLFHEHHYMTCNKPINESLPKSCKFFTWYWLKDDEEILVGCLGVINQISKYPARRITRMVILPEFQGLGISKYMLNSISELYKRNNITMYIATFHPRLGQFFDKNKLWKPSNNNLQEFRKNEEVPDGHQLKDGLRDGVKMYRYNYSGYNPYDIIYDTVELSALETKFRETKDELLIPKINKIRKQKNEEKIEILPENSTIESKWHQKAKEETKKLFKKNKRIPLTKEERKIAKAKLKEQNV